MGKATEYGICLNDEDFEPFIEELLDESNYACCQKLIDSKKFLGEQEACKDFEQAESLEIDDNSPLGRQLKRLTESGELNPETLKEAIFEEKIRNIDWEPMPVDRYVKQLESHNKKEQKAGIFSLGGMICLGNKEAFKALFKFLQQLPSPNTLEEVYLKKEILEKLKNEGAKHQLIPYLIDELYRTLSSNTTRQWISAIFKFLEHSPKDKIREPLEKMLKDKRFSYRLKNKMKNILYYD